jgi:hypothetical protein
MTATRVYASLMAALVLVAPATVASQGGRTTILVGTGDAETGAFLSSVQIRIASLNVSQVTDSMGRARVTGLRGGTYTIEARRVGYAPLTAPVLVRDEDSLEVILLLRSTAMRLDTVVVASTSLAMHLRDFEKRRAKGVGQFITGEQIDSVPGASLKAIIESHVRGVTVVGENISVHIMSGRQATDASLRPGSGGVAPCWPVIFVDGVQLVDDTGRGPDIGFISLSSIGGIEFYESSEAPPAYRVSGALQTPSALRPTPGGRGGTQNPVGGFSSPSCGVMLIWSRG